VDWQAGEELMITVRDAQQQNIPIRIHGRNICLHFRLNVAMDWFNKYTYHGGFLTKDCLPIPSMYGIYTYIWLILMVNVGK